MRPAVFWPPAIVLLAALFASTLNFDGFLAFMTSINTAMLSQFGWLFSIATFAGVVLLGGVFISPLGGVRIGGEDATPILRRWNWFAITLCTTIATGILFWGAAEPIFHVSGPPDFANVNGDPDAAARFALSTVYLHWSITPYAIYATAALAFALAFHNLKGKYSLSAPLSVLIGSRANGVAGNLLDALALYALVAGVAASLGAGVMTLAGGLEKTLGVADTIWSRLGVTVAIVMVYVASSVSGLQRGIKFLSDINVRIFFVLAAFIFLAGPSMEIMTLGAESLGAYIQDFVPRSIGLGGLLNDPWTNDWTVFFFANWLAWAPITAMFLGRIAVGYTVREFLLFNLILPAIFGIVWMTIFGASAITADASTGGSLVAALNAAGPESVIYALLDFLPFTQFVVFAFILTTFVSFVTAMDSNTHSIAGVCIKSSEPTVMDGRAAVSVKIFWGVLIGAISWVMTSTNGIDGIRMLVNLGGAPGLLIMLGSGFVLIRLMMRGAEALNTPS
ncbi:MAG: BCCT family transporter [Pseudomonadota bacterium]